MISQVTHTGSRRKYQTVPLRKLYQIKKCLLAGKTLICDTADCYYIFQYKNGSVFTKFVEQTDYDEEVNRETYHMDFSSALEVITTMWYEDGIECCYCDHCGFEGEKLNYTFDK